MNSVREEGSQGNQCRLSPPNQSIWLEPSVALPCWTLQRWERLPPLAVGGSPGAFGTIHMELRESFPKRKKKSFMGKQLVDSSKAALKVATLAPWSSKSLELGFDPVNFPPEERSRGSA